MRTGAPCVSPRRRRGLSGGDDEPLVFSVERTSTLLVFHLPLGPTRRDALHALGLHARTLRGVGN
eukprot:363437-Chlamydomonas_euryale.AAC.6